MIVQLGKLIALRADGDFTWVELEGRKPIYWCRRLGELVEKLPEEMFFRLDRKPVVQKSKVLHLERKSRDEGWLYLEGRCEPLIIRRRALARLSQLLAGC